MNWYILVISYLLIINIFGFTLMGLDKWKAIHDKWRIKEKTLWTSFIIGGSIGGFIGMRLFHHKTRHQNFAIGIPLLIMVQIGILVAIQIVS